MIVIAALAMGAATGALTALRRGGSRLDAAQYAAGFGIAFGLAGVFLSIALDRMM